MCLIRIREAELSTIAGEIAAGIKDLMAKAWVVRVLG